MNNYGQMALSIVNLIELLQMDYDKSLKQLVLVDVESELPVL